MARATHYCSACSEPTTLYASSRREVDRKLEWYERNRPECGKCLARKESEVAAAKAAEMELAALQGTDKQIAWAEVIRVERIDALMAILEGGIDPDEQFDILRDRHGDTVVDDVLSRLCAETRASWWINNRELSLSQLAGALAVRIENDAKPENDPALAAAVDFEAVLRPAHPLTETIASFAMLPDGFDIRFPEKHDAFREAVKAFGARWDEIKRAWHIAWPEPIALAAEVAQHLIGCGFVIRILEEEIRAIIASGDVPKSEGRKIDFAGKDFFRVDWRRIDGDFYDEVRSVHGSKWDKKNQTVLVPLVAADDLRDFAERFGFPMTEQAIAAAEAFDDYRRAGMIEGKKRDNGEAAPILDRVVFPDVITIDPSLLD